MRRDTDGNTARGSSSARYASELSGGGNWTSEAGIRQMQAFAISQGLPWVANNPDLLRLGPSAIKALADVQLRQESFTRLQRDAGFAAKDVVTLARYAKEKGLDANKLSGDVADGIKALAGDDKLRQDELRKATIGFLHHPDDPAARANLDRVVKQYDTDPVKKAAADKFIKDVTGRDREIAATATAIQDQSPATQTAITTKTAARDAFDSLPSTPPQTSSKQQPAAVPQAATPSGGQSAPQPTPPATQAKPPAPK